MKKPITIILLATVFYVSVAREVPEEVPHIQVKQGLVSGIREASVHGKKFNSYYNIPYAEPPINELRFKDPVPKTSWNGVHDGSKRPQRCNYPLYSDALNIDKGNMKIFGGEDCLILNVFTPKSRSADRNFPVMFYIHGGGFYTGSSFEYEPYILMDEDIVLVTIQYRLGILGFLSTEDEVLPGNMGLKDQQLALKWVNENIEKFGGDPKQITVFGGSAGAISVNLHMMSPGSKDLFHGAIMQAGSALCPFATTTDSLVYAKAAGDLFNCSLDEGTEVYLKCMQSVDVRPLIEFEIRVSKFAIMATPFIPRVDGVFLPDQPAILLKTGNYHKVNLISGVARNDGASNIMGITIKPKLLEDLNNNFKEVGPTSLSFEDEENSLNLTVQAYMYYTGKTTGFTEEDFDNLAELYSDRDFKIPQYLNAKYFSKDADIDAYLYEFDHFGAASDGVAVPGFDRKNWVNHQDSLYYLFGPGGPRFNIPFTNASDIKVREFFVTAWTNFAEHLDPNIESLPCDCTWEPATEENFRYLSLKEYPAMKDFDFPAFDNFWSKLKIPQYQYLLKD